MNLWKINFTQFSLPNHCLKILWWAPFQVCQSCWFELQILSPFHRGKSVWNPWWESFKPTLSRCFVQGRKSFGQIQSIRNLWELSFTRVKWENPRSSLNLKLIQECYLLRKSCENQQRIIAIFEEIIARTSRELLLSSRKELWEPAENCCYLWGKSCENQPAKNFCFGKVQAVVAR